MGVVRRLAHREGSRWVSRGWMSSFVRLDPQDRDCDFGPLKRPGSLDSFLVTNGSLEKKRQPETIGRQLNKDGSFKPNGFSGASHLAIPTNRASGDRIWGLTANWACSVAF